VQVIEAINLFLAGEYPNCIFVIAMEPDMVAAHVEAAYGTLVARFERQGADAIDLGWRFLEKIVQLPLTLPALEPDRAAGFAQSLFGAREEEPPPEPEPEDAATTVQQAETASLTDAVALAGTVNPASAAADAVRRSVSRRLAIEDPEVREAIAYAGGHLDANPREIKRFVNVFRFLVMIHTERAIEGLTTAASLDQLAKLALVSTRWPALMSTLAKPAGGGTVFEVLEVDDNPRAELAKAGIPEAVQERLLVESLFTLLRAKPVVGSPARHYL
jgi:hypothetical protein